MKRNILLTLAAIATGTAFSNAQSVTLTPNGKMTGLGESPGLILRSYNIPVIQAERSTASVELPQKVLNDYSLLFITGRGHDGVAYSNDASRIRLATSEEWFPGKHGTKIQFFTTENSTALLKENMRLDHTGHLGIGTTSPDEKLHVKDGKAKIEDSSPFIFLKTTGAAGSGNAGITFQNSLNQTKAVMNFNHVDDGLRIVHGSSTTDGLHLKSGNKLGLGLTEPAGKMHIKYNSNLGDPHLVLEENNLGYSRLSFTNTGTDERWTIAAKSEDAAANSIFNIYSSNFGDVATFDGNGNTKMNGFTQLGSDAPKVKMKKITGTTDNDSSTLVLHGLSSSKILDVRVFITFAGTTTKISPNNPSSLFTYSSQFDVDTINLGSVPVNLRGQAYQILITYEE